MHNYLERSKIVAIGILIAAFGGLLCLAESTTEGDELGPQTQEFIKREKIDLDNSAVGNPLKSDVISLADIERITGSPMIHESLTPYFDKTATVRIFGFKDPDERAGIQISFFSTSKNARRWAVETFLHREQGRAPNGVSVETNNSSIGDLCIRPKRVTRDPHGFDTSESDKTLCVFVRGCTVVCVDSARNLAPSIPVIEISRKIDAFLGKADTKREAPKPEQDGAGQPATRPVDESEGSGKPQPAAEGRSR